MSGTYCVWVMERRPWRPTKTSAGRRCFDWFRTLYQLKWLFTAAVDWTLKLKCGYYHVGLVSGPGLVVIVVLLERRKDF